MMSAVVHHEGTTAGTNISVKPTSFANAAVNLLHVLDALVTGDNLPRTQMIKFTQADAVTSLLLQQCSIPSKALLSIPGKETEINIHGHQVVCSSRSKDKDAICSTFLSALKQPVISPRGLPRNFCVVCKTRFSSRSKLFKHLRCKGHGQNWTSTALLVELQALMGLLNNKTYKSHRTQLCYGFWCLQKILNTLPHLQPHEARRVARTRAHNGATILHFVVDLWSICKQSFPSKVISETVPKSGTTTQPFPAIMPSIVRILKRLISWTIRSSKIPPKSTINKNKLELASSKPVWCGPWFTKHSASARGEYCGYQNGRLEAQQALDSKSLTEFVISNDSIWTHRDCKPGETALQAAQRLGCAFLFEATTSGTEDVCVFDSWRQACDQSLMPPTHGTVLAPELAPKHHPKCHSFGLHSSHTLWVATLRNLVFSLPAHTPCSLASTLYARSTLTMLANNIPPGVPHTPGGASVLHLILELWARLREWGGDGVRQSLLRLVECGARADSSLAHEVFSSAVDDAYWVTGVSDGESALHIATRLINTDSFYYDVVCVLCGLNPEHVCARECVGCCQSILECDWLHTDPRFASDSRLLMAELRALLSPKHVGCLPSHSSSCGVVACESAWRSWLQEQVYGADMATASTLMCLCGQRAEECAVSQVFVRNHMSARAFALYERRTLESLLRRTHDFRWCCHCESGGFVPRKCLASDITSSSTTSPSPTISTVTCPDCEGPFTLVDSVSASFTTHDRLTTERANTSEWKKKNCRVCPKCQTRIFRDGGCSHITCQVCKYEFCWICLGPYQPGRYSLTDKCPCLPKT